MQNNGDWENTGEALFMLALKRSQRPVRAPGLQGDTPWFVGAKNNGSWVGSAPGDGRAPGQWRRRVDLSQKPGSKVVGEGYMATFAGMFTLLPTNRRRSADREEEWSGSSPPSGNQSDRLVNSKSGRGLHALRDASREPGLVSARFVGSKNQLSVGWGLRPGRARSGAMARAG